MANDYLRDQDVQQSSNTSNRIVAFFEDKDDAYSAVRDLRAAGFTSDQIGLAFRDQDDYSASGGSFPIGENSRSDISRESQDSSSDNKSMWQEVKDFFTGSDHDVNEDDYYRSDFRNSTEGFNWSNDRSNYYQQGLESGGAIVTVSGSRVGEARSILEQHDGDLRESGFDASRFSTRNLNADDDVSAVRDNVVDRDVVAEGSAYRQNNDVDVDQDVDRDRRIQLRGELLRTYKERVQRGEVRLRKEVVSENQTVNVPVTREELVIERVAGSNAAAPGEIGDDQEIRVPLSEERVRVDKQPVVNEEVRVGKRQVQNTQQVSDTVRHEELRVDKDGDVEVNDADRKRDRKKPAA